jgi:hypothetical protein
MHEVFRALVPQQRKFPPRVSGVSHGGARYHQVVQQSQRVRFHHRTRRERQPNRARDLVPRERRVRRPQPAVFGDGHRDHSDEEVSSSEQGPKVFRYCLQILQNYKWRTVALLEPIPESPDCAACNDYGCDECCNEEFFGFGDPGEVDYITVFDRAHRALGNTELALEAARLYPGDFI